MSQVQNKINQALQLHRAGQVLDAIKVYEEVLPSQQGNAHLFYLLGTAYVGVNRTIDAEKALKQSIGLDKRNADAHYNLGILLAGLKRFDEALACYDKALGINPNHAPAYTNRGVVLENLNRRDEALTSYDAAIRIDPNLAETYWNKSLLLILIGEFRKGWELYEWGWKAKNRTPERNYSRQLLPDSQCPKNALFFIYPEQGLGDTIQFCRYVKRMANQGARVVFEVPPVLHSLISSLDPRITVISSGDAIPDFDYQSPLLSLPWVFKTEVETIPSERSYLSIPEPKKTEWSRRLGPKKKPRVGLVWSGGTVHKNDVNRSVRLEEILPLLHPSIEWHSLQKDYRSRDLELLNRHSEIHQHQDHLNDFTDTGALIEEMDLVISVDTSVAHLAGALGKPLWMLLSYVPDSRWLLDRDDTPWYPSATLYRQDESREWPSVIDRVGRDLGALFRSDAKCPVCGGHSMHLDLLNLNKSCEELRGTFLPPTRKKSVTNNASRVGMFLRLKSVGGRMICYVPNYLRLPRHFDSGIFKGIFSHTPLTIARKRQA